MKVAMMASGAIVISVRELWKLTPFQKQLRPGICRISNLNVDWNQAINVYATGGHSMENIVKDPRI